jgi:serine/threonine-protein kinase
VKLPTDRGYRLYPYTPLDGGLEGLNHYPLNAVAEGDHALEFRHKTVLIGASDDPALARQARAVAAMLQQQTVSVPDWSLWGQYGALLAVTLLLTLLLPRMGYAAAAVTVLLTSLLLINGEFLLLVLGKQWLPLMLPLLLLWLGYPLIAFRRYLAMHHEQLADALSVANRQLGRMLQSQGELELALEKYRRCRVDEELLEQLYHLGLDFERKRQFSKAVSVFQYLDSLSRGFRDVSERIQRNQSMEQRIVLAKGGGATAEGTVIIAAEGLQNPTVGHYQIERELGRGAMGMVYLGKDPRIGRAVAIKTMALSSEFEGAQLEEVKQRFYREAETAGRLNHPNIVHVYDIGEEQELAYIAMDYLQGRHLGHFTSKKTLLPLKEVLGIAEQVADALDYAHKQSVVHRDIKPANIIYDSKAGAVKVTDFGVACLTDSSKTKTGTVLGSPSYMSPEQVAGKRVDGRADIFSLGVTLYQMVTGHLPFEADSLGSLMYKIANEAHPKPSKYRKGIPICASRIINKCMQKDPARRYQSGGELAAALKRCRGK